MRNISIEKNRELTPDMQETEIVERKGIGHPDTLIDGIMEEISSELSKEYLKEHGTILHHNVDKGLIVGGRAKPKYGGGKVLMPIYILLTGRATAKLGDVDIPVHSIGIATARKYLKKYTRHLNVDSDVIIDSKIFEGSGDLNAVFNAKESIPLANDTSFGIGYAPFTDAEKLTYEVEMYLNSSEYKQKRPFVGEDIKVMTLREGKKVRMIVAAAFVDSYVDSAEDYFDKKKKVTEDLKELTKKLTELEVDVNVNTADSSKHGSVYITVTGLSCEMGDDGSVGRGNRINGLITPLRSMTLEAAAGKNPVNHVGKIYSVAATELAKKLVKEMDEVEGCTVTLLSQIGQPIDQPKVASIRINTNEDIARLKPKVASYVDSYLADITSLTLKIVEGRIGNCYNGK